MAIWTLAVRHRRFILLGSGLWLLGELLSGPAPYPLLYISILGGIGLVFATAWLFPSRRYHVVSLLVATIPVRIFADDIREALARFWPEGGVAFEAAGLAAAILLGARAVAALSWPLDRVTLRRPWFAEERVLVPRPRAEVWRALCLTDNARHWDLRVAGIRHDPRFPTRYTVELSAGSTAPERIVLREIDRTEEVFQEIETEPAEGFLHGLGPIMSVLLEEVPRGTRVTLGLELHDASLLRLGRLFLDAPLTGYIQHFRADMDRRPALAGKARRKRLAA